METIIVVIIVILAAIYTTKVIILPLVNKKYKKQSSCSSCVDSKNCPFANQGSKDMDCHNTSDDTKDTEKHS